MRLKPRLVPRPLWYLSLAKLARSDPNIGNLVGIDSREIIIKISDLWHNDLRKKMVGKSKGKCELCGEKPGKIIDEVWRYEVDKANKRGIAILEDLKYICEKCNLVIHFGFASVIGKGKDAIAWMKKVNKLADRQVMMLIEEAVSKWKKLNKIRNWIFRLDYLRKEYPEIADKLEILLNSLYDLTLRGYMFENKWVRVLRDGNREYLKRRLNPEEIQNRLINGARSLQMTYHEESIELFSYLINIGGFERLELDERKIVLNAIREGDLDAVKMIYEKVKNRKLYPCTLVGKWLFYVESDEAYKLFRIIGDKILEGEISAIGAKTPTYKDNRKPIIVYYGNTLDMRGVGKLLEELRSLGISARMFYKPDIFTEYGIYSRKSKFKPYLFSI